MPTARQTSRSTSALRVTVSDGRGRPLAGMRLGPWLARAAPRSARGQVAVALVSDRTMRALNRRYRHRDHATDVLSFPAAWPGEGRRTAGPGGPPALLGDIVIARGVASRQARKQGHSRAVELRILALHGLLHLLGYDHEADGGRMARVEERLRRRAGLPSGLTARASGARPRR